METWESRFPSFHSGSLRFAGALLGPSGPLGARHLPAPGICRVPGCHWGSLRCLLGDPLVVPVLAERGLRSSYLKITRSGGPAVPPQAVCVCVFRENAEPF